ncbi:unnamed protein product [Phytophthora lilii]|uniref:Unnamed protein product n=1 Tax=Phytophthora lilii TaxID=2077276 RepID=A0A9W7CIA2_9STRA|nr:unnamed protein product [Phytophthora lilii]
MNTRGAVFLYHKELASSQAINQVIESATSLVVIKLLQEDKNVSDESVVAAFRKAFSRGRQYVNNKSDDEQLEIVKFLYKLDRIPPTVNGEAFAVPAGNRDMELINCLREDSRISFGAVNDAFLSAARHGNGEVMKLLYDVKLISPSTLFRAFTKTSSYEYHFVVEEAVKYLCANGYVSHEIRAKAFIFGAKRGWTWAMSKFTESEGGNGHLMN